MQLARSLPYLLVLFLMAVGLRSYQAWEGARIPQAAPTESQANDLWTDQLVDPAELWLDAALIRTDRGSREERLLVAGSVPLLAGETFELYLQFVDPRLPARGLGGSFGLHNRERRLPGTDTHTPARFFRSEALPTGWAPCSTDQTLSGTLVGSGRGIHLLALGAGGLEYDPGGGGSLDFGLNGLAAMGGMTVCSYSAKEELALLIGIRKPDGPRLRLDDLQAWSDRFLDAAERLTPTPGDASEELASELYQGRRSYTSKDAFMPIDPGLELANLALALSDGNLAASARRQLGDGLEGNLARVDELHLRHATQLGKIGGWVANFSARTIAERTAALVAVGALDYAELDTRGPVEPSQKNRNLWNHWRSYFGRLGSPVRALSVAYSPQLCAAIVDFESESTNANYRISYAQAAVKHENLGDSEAARAAWPRLREVYLDDVGWQARILLRGPAAILLWILLPWLIAMAITFAPGRRDGEPLISRGWLAILLIVSAVGLANSPSGWLATPGWILLGRGWLKSGKRPWWHTTLVLFTLGLALSAVMTFFHAYPSVPILETWIESSSSFGLFVLGLHFASRDYAWNSSAWRTVLIALVVLGILATQSLSGSTGVALLVAFFALQFYFWATSDGDAAGDAPTAATAG